MMHAFERDAVGLYVAVVLRAELILSSELTMCGTSIVYHGCEAGSLADVIQIKEAESHNLVRHVTVHLEH